jgi:hypothetical protein
MFGTSDEVVHDCILEGCTVVGQRINWCYNDASDGETDLPKSGNVVRNSHFDRLPTKHDTNVPFNPNAISSWSINYGVGYEGSTFMNRVTSAGFEHEFFGVRSTRDPDTEANPGPGNNAGWPQFVEDRSQFQSGPKDGWGDYRPLTGSPLLTFNGSPRCLNATCDTFRDGTVKAAAFGAGAEPVAGGPPVNLAAAFSAHPLADGGAGLSWAGGVQPANGQQGMVDGGARLRAEAVGGRARARLLRVARETRVLRVDPD